MRNRLIHLNVAHPGSLAAQWFVLALLGFALTGSAGCAALRNPMKPGLPWATGKDGKISQATKIVPIWSDAVMHRAQEPPQRGFGGRIYFYNTSQDSAPGVKVRGQLEVYAYEEDKPHPSNRAPDRKFVFAADDFEQLRKKDPKMGHSYNVYIPYEAAEGPRKKVSLIARFVPEKGSILLSEQSTVILPGTEPASPDGQGTTTGHLSGGPGQPLTGTLNPLLQGQPPQEVSLASFAAGEIPRLTPPAPLGANPSPFAAAGGRTIKTTTIPMRGTAALRALSSHQNSIETAESQQAEQPKQPRTRLGRAMQRYGGATSLIPAEPGQEPDSSSQEAAEGMQDNLRQAEATSGQAQSLVGQAMAQANSTTAAKLHSVETMTKQANLLGSTFIARQRPGAGLLTDSPLHGRQAPASPAAPKGLYHGLRQPYR